MILKCSDREYRKISKTFKTHSEVIEYITFKKGHIFDLQKKCVLRMEPNHQLEALGAWVILYKDGEFTYYDYEDNI